MKRLILALGLAACAAVAMPALAKDTYVHTPVGRMRSDCVHTLPSGSVVSERAGGEGLQVHDSTGAFLRDIPRCLEQDTRPLLERTLLARQKQQRKGKILLREGIGAEDLRLPGGFPSDYDGWEAYTVYNNPTGIDVFLGNFSVPDAPAQSPDILYIFTGLQNVDWIPKVDPEVAGFDIIQPVLQYPSDSGFGWSVKSWYVTLDDGALQSSEVAVATGHVVFGNMTQTDRVQGSWFIGSQIVETGQSTNLRVTRPRLVKQLWAYNTLECYGCQDCSTYPLQPSKFTDLALFYNGQRLQEWWKLNPKPNPSPKCNETIDIITPETQYITFQPPK